MKFAIAGASGLVGHQLVPSLSEKGIEVLIIGRDTVKLQAQFPDHQVADYQGMKDVLSGCDALLYLATINNDQNASDDAFKRVNVDLALEACRTARLAGVKRFVYFSSIHALDEGNSSPYAVSKRTAEASLLKEQGIDVNIVYLPVVLGDKVGGRLAFIDRLPRVARQCLLSVASALKPSVSIGRIAESMLAIDRAAKIGDRRFLVCDGQQANLFFRIFKRLMDLSAAVVLFALLSWLMLIIWVLVRLQSPGPGLFKQVRVGKNERTFTCYKFRTMHVSTPNVGTHEVAASAITSIGAVLRRTKLDELPQFFNVIMNQMSLVGPRPCLPSQDSLIVERRQRGVWALMPGLTGLAQVNGVDMSTPERLAVEDQRYLYLQCLLLDIKLILKTLGIGRGAKS